MTQICTAAITLGTFRTSVQARRSVSFRTLQQQYGDGYVSRRQDGVNPVMEIWAVETPPLDTADALALEAELIALGVGDFAWTPPFETEAKNWILDPVRWDWNYLGDDRATISFTLKRWYD